MMKKIILLAGFMVFSMTAFAADLAVKGKTIHTMDGKTIIDGVVLIKNGRITKVGKESRVRIPKNVRVLEAAVVTPGFIDAHSTLGLSGIYGGRAGQVRDQDQLEKSDPVQPELSPLDAYNAQEPLIKWARQYGVTTMHTGHGPGAVISGRTMVVKTRGATVEEALMSENTAIAITLGRSSARNFDSPGNRSKAVAMLREAFLEAEDYGRKLKSKKPPSRDIGKETLLQVLSGEIKAMITANNTSDINTALRLQREFGFELLLDSAADAHLMTELIKEADVSVLLHAPMLRAGGETKNASFASGAAMAAAKIPFAFQTGFEGYVPKTRVLLYEVQVAVANGLSPDAALSAITITPAKLLGIDKRVGSIRKGKDGDLVLFDGDPFEYTSHVCGVVIDGEVVSEACH